MTKIGAPYHALFHPLPCVQKDTNTSKFSPFVEVIVQGVAANIRFQGIRFNKLKWVEGFFLPQLVSCEILGLALVTMKITAFWGVTSCSLVDKYRCCGEPFTSVLRSATSVLVMPEN
jgi:hypothetical protein